MNIKQALKEKNKVVNKNAENLERLQKYNSIEVESERAYDPRKSMEDLINGVNELVELKTSIHKANIKVYDKIFRLSELKSLAKQLKTIDCSSGKIHSYRGMEPVVKKSEISFVERDLLVKKLEAEIEIIQDELDTHNAKTKI